MSEGSASLELAVSHATHRFEETLDFYEDVLGYSVVDGWDSPSNGRGAYFSVGQNGIVEIVDASAPGGWGEPPPSDGFFILIFVAEVEAHRLMLQGRSVASAWPLTVEPFGIYFGVRDPNDVMIYFMERRGDAKKRLLALQRSGSVVLCRGGRRFFKGAGAGCGINDANDPHDVFDCDDGANAAIFTSAGSSLRLNKYSRK